MLLAVCVQYSTKVFKDDKWAIHYYAPIQGHELATRRDLIPSEPDHPRAGNWYQHQRRPLHERVQARSTTSSSKKARSASYT
jgi:hypothetical protein